MKIKSYNREKIQSEISLEIIRIMNDITLKKNGTFTLLILENFNDIRSEKYKTFLKSNNINSIKCLMPKGKKFEVPGEGHPNEISHYEISKCIQEKLKIK